MAASGENRWSYLVGPRWGWPYLVCGRRETFSERLGELCGAGARVNAVPLPPADTRGRAP